MKKFWGIVTGKSFMALLALVGFGLAIYTAFFYERKPHLVFSASTPTKVFDVHQPIGGLEISYGGENLRGGRSNLWVMSVTLRNEGNAEVGMGDYDARELLGIRVLDGQLLEQPAVQSESKYILRNVGLVRSANDVRFSPFIIEPGESVTLSLLILGSDTVRPKIAATGRVAGASEVEVRSADSGVQSGIIKDAFYAERWWIQLIRILAYSLLFVLLMAALAVASTLAVAPLEKAREKRKRADRREKVDGFRLGDSLSAEERSLAGLYLEGGMSALGEANRTILRLLERQKVIEDLTSGLGAERFKEIAADYFSLSWAMREGVDDLEKGGLIGLQEMEVAQLRALLDVIEKLRAHFDPAFDLNEDHGVFRVFTMDGGKRSYRLDRKRNGEIMMD